MQQTQLDRYSFWWSEVRLVIAAAALFMGGVPPIYSLFHSPASWGIITNLLTLCWLISGAAALYLLYRWSKNKMLFGHKQTQDTAAFFITVVSGINLGLAGLIKRNIGMSIFSNHIIFIIVGILYLWAAYHLYNRFQSHGEKIF